MRASHRRGFTLIEMMIVVVIIGIGLAIAIFSVTRSRESVSIDKATAQVRSAIEETRSLASLVGSRSGTPRVTEDGSCGWTGNQMEVTIDAGAGTVVYPSEVVTVAPGVIQARCETLRPLTSLNDQGANASFISPAGVTKFAFSPTGRLVAGPSIMVRIVSANEDKANGFRVLTSGVMCQSSLTAPPPGEECDENTDW